MTHTHLDSPARTTHPAHRWAVWLIALLIVGACSPSEATRTATQAPLGFTPAPLQWDSCGGRLQCASLEVPLDYEDPNGPTIDLAMAMLPATDPGARIGVLVTNPGGPGGSGVDYLGNDGPFNDDIDRHFDIVSWDPRGVGRTTPLACGDQLAQSLLTVDLAPTDPEGHDTLERAALADAGACAIANRGALRHVGTDDAVMDVEAIRLALGGEPITYVGFSYGTLIGLRYAERFPNSLRAMALDGIVDPEQTLGDQLTTTAASVDRSLAAVLNSCEAECPIDGDPLGAFRYLVETARDEPLRTDDDREIAANAVVLAGIAVTYDESLRELFYAAVADGQDGRGNLLEQFAEGLMGEFDLAPTVAVYCGDLPHPTSTDQIDELATTAARDATTAPGLISGYIRAFTLPCLDWPVYPPTTVDPVTAAGSPPILVIGNTGDPVTPYESAQRVADTLAEGHLLTYHGTGHNTYGKDHCADIHIDSYLVNLELPPDGAECPG